MENQKREKRPPGEVSLLWRFFFIFFFSLQFYVCVCVCVLLSRLRPSCAGSFAATWWQIAGSPRSPSAPTLTRFLNYGCAELLKSGRQKKARSSLRERLRCLYGGGLLLHTWKGIRRGTAHHCLLKCELYSINKNWMLWRGKNWKTKTSFSSGGESSLQLICPGSIKETPPSLTIWCNVMLHVLYRDYFICGLVRWLCVASFTVWF